MYIITLGLFKRASCCSAAAIAIVAILVIQQWAATNTNYICICKSIVFNFIQNAAQSKSLPLNGWMCNTVQTTAIKSYRTIIKALFGCTCFNCGTANSNSTMCLQLQQQGLHCSAAEQNLSDFVPIYFYNFCSIVFHREYKTLIVVPCTVLTKFKDLVEEFLI